MKTLTQVYKNRRNKLLKQRAMVERAIARMYNELNAIDKEISDLDAERPISIADELKGLSAPRGNRGDYNSIMQSIF